MTPEETRAGGQQLWAAIGRDAATEPGDARALLTDLYGTNRRGGVNTRAAAAALGVSARTVQRWVKTGRLPENANGQRARRDWRASGQARAARMNPRREARLRNRGTNITFKGLITVSRSDRRRRSVSLELDGEQLGAILDALLAGNDQAAHDALEDAFSEALGGDVELVIESLSTKG